MKIGFRGLGNVGGKLAGSLLRNKFNLTVIDLDTSLVKNFVSKGSKSAKSTFSAKSFGDFADVDPLETKSFTKLVSKSITVKLNLFLNKLPASLPPTLPRPIKPIFILPPFNF